MKTLTNIRKLKQKGFTLIELIICLALVVIVPLAFFWGYLLVKLLLASIGFLEANS